MRYLVTRWLPCLLAVFCGCVPAPRREAPRIPPPSPAAPRPVTPPAPAKPVPVLCLYSEDLRYQGLDNIDPKALAFYRDHGFELHAACYQTTDAATLARYPVVVGMMPMLHAGTRAIDERLGSALEAYIREGGSFALLPAPSYYGGEDFVRQLNPWLSRFGGELLNEPPRDPAHQRTITRVIGYRYLETTNLAPHAITRGVDHLWLPLDYTDAYVLTHTLRLTPDWETLVRGNPTCASYPLGEISAGRQVPGTYRAAPPFLAVRSWGKGRIALFATSSQYFIFDAYHWAFGDGFVMREGGERLMVNLLSWLAETAVTQTNTAAPEVAAPVAHGNVALCQDKAAWFKLVQKQFCPPGSRPVAYIDCGALTDLPYSPERGLGFTESRSWPVRWTWSDLFHPTASNARAFQKSPAVYRFDHLVPGRAYQLGVLRWAYQSSGARPFNVAVGPLVLAPALDVPCFADRQGPAFSVLDIPAPAISTQGTLEVSFTMIPGTDDFSSIGDLWLFEAGAGSVQSGFDKCLAEQAAPRAGLCEPSPGLRPFRGLIGARSVLSGGPSTVAELAAAARTAGYDFLVFTEDANRLDEKGLATLKQACEAASDDRFRCLPGLGFSATAASGAGSSSLSAYVLQEVETLPPRQDFGNPYRLFWGFLGGERAGGKSVVPTLSTPALNGISPFYQRFWRGLDVFTLSPAGTLSANARDLYADLMAAGYGPYPRLSGNLQTPAAIATAARGGWAVTLFANSLSQLAPYHYTSTVGNGPRFRDYHFSSDDDVHGLPGEGFLFRGDAWLVVHADIEAASAIDRVTLYSGRTPLRVWTPGRSRVRIQEPVHVARNHELWMQVHCVDGTGALTGPYHVEDRGFMLAMCSDNQNTICSVANPPRAFERDARDLYVPHSYWHTGEAAGQLGALRLMSELVPRVMETGVVQPVKQFHPCPALSLADGTTEDHRLAELRILGASCDYNQVEYRYDTPASQARSRVLITSFKPARSGDTVLLVETTLEAKTNIEFATRCPGLRHLQIAPLRELAPAWNYTYRAASGTLVSRPFDYAAPNREVADTLAPGGGVMVWPSDVGSLLVLPLDTTPYDLNLNVLPAGTGREQVQLLTHPARLARGQVVASRILVLLHQGLVASGTALETIRAALVDCAGCVRSVRQGRLVEAVYAVTVQAEKHGMAATLDTARRTEPLPVVLHGVNPAWPCGLVSSREFRLLEAADSVLRFTVPQGQEATSSYAGNVVLSDQEGLRIEWVGVEDGQVVLHLHNPAAHLMKARIWTPSMPGQVPRLDASCEVLPGASVWVKGQGKTLQVLAASGTRGRGAAP